MLNQAGISSSQLIRFQDTLAQKYGGWSLYYADQSALVPRDLHGWLDLRGVANLGIGATTALQVLREGQLRTITPQTTTSEFTLNFSTTVGSPIVSIIDANILNVTTYDAVFFNTPVIVGGLKLTGLYQIASILGATSYTINAGTNATSTVANGGVVPVFTTTSGSSFIEVEIPGHGLSVGSTVVFPVTTTGNGVTILGSYLVAVVVDADAVQFVVSTAASASGSFSMNAGFSELVYYLQIGPSPPGVGYGLGNYGSGFYGYGSGSGSSQTGTPITATDWTQDNWGQLLVACPEGGPIYVYDPAGGFNNAGVIATAPPANRGIFISTSQQILIAWGSSYLADFGWAYDPLWVSWSAVGDYTDFAVRATNQAGGFRIPIGSKLVAGMAVSNQNLLWTDLDLWAMSYVGPPNVFGFNKIGAGAGAVSSHAVQQLRGGVYWMGRTNFYRYGGSGVEVVPCSVWDAVFQNLNQSYLSNIRAMPNTPFNEVGWLYPSAASTSGECDSYVKFNITEQNQPWDYGTLGRSAWIDQGALGMPIAAAPDGYLYQHETTMDAAGVPLAASFTTGYFYLAEGENFVTIDQVLPDFKWEAYSGGGSAQVQLTFLVTNYPGDAPRSYGPYTVTQDTSFISVRFRGRLMAISVSSGDLDSFWRLGLIKYRYARAGRR